MKKKPLVSVVMAEYNTDLELLNCSIRSILDQTYGNFEFIIIDDCGKNNVNEIVKKYHDKRIIVLKNNRNRGLVYSLNKGIKNAKGKYIARMDTDDFSYPNRLEVEVEFLENNPKYSLVASNCDFYNDNGVWGRLKSGSCEITEKKLLRSGSIIHPTVMVSTAALKKIGGYLNFERCEDYATWIELYLNNFKLYKIDEILLKYHLGLEDYKKRTLKKRKGFFKFLREQYIKLNPTRFDYFKIYIKTIIAGIMPYKVMYNYHRRKLK